MLEHPDITNVNLTGYPQTEAYTQVIVQCPTCNNVHHVTEVVLCYRSEHYFCNQSCFVEWMLNNDDLSWSEVGD
ncbi:hypothetical protein MH117_09845 [Paenibacillus sp. ACRRX]|uniref:hypothetical protein n=1 Tax=Paenibacillus sp. ACRRX TaxID=2918206 RepID=UPI001EF4D132|nr:hypothetical protein [Paenibacillus sp. ACRRX]MCG7407725.1 hypothetical protein [Paenibacillus sp. ACRRX]